MKRRRFIGGVALAPFAPAAFAAFAAEYLTVDAAQRALFPDADQFAAVSLAKGVVALGVGAARAARLRAFAARKDSSLLGYVVVDDVIGKFEYITYAVALTPAIAVAGVEILAYRESHGYEIRQPAWRHQFVGKGADAPIKVGIDIANISGATLSSTHVTDGVREIVQVAKVSFG
jgi:Na+-translocating ferredoxin:NAD+ oxidoreductase RnfG subunit